MLEDSKDTMNETFQQPTEICKWKKFRSGWRKRKEGKNCKLKELVAPFFCFFFLSKTRRCSSTSQENPGLYRNAMIYFDICYTMISDVCNLLASHLFKNLILWCVSPSWCSENWLVQLVEVYICLRLFWCCTIHEMKKVVTVWTLNIIVRSWQIWHHQFNPLFFVALHANIPHVLASH